MHIWHHKYQLREMAWKFGWNLTALATGDVSNEYTQRLLSFEVIRLWTPSKGFWELILHIQLKGHAISI